MRNAKLRKFLAAVLTVTLVLGMFIIAPQNVSAAGELSDPPAAGDIAVRNYITGIDDRITVSGLSEGDVIKVYDAASGGNLLGYVQAAASGVAVINNFLSGQLGPGAGTVYITRTTSSKEESVRTSVAYGEEPLPWLIYDHTVNKGEDYKHSNFASGQTNSRYSGSTLSSHTPATYPAYPNGDDSSDHNTDHNKHIIVKDNGDRVTFYGYGTSGYKDFMFLPSGNSAERTVSFDFDLSTVSFHTLEGAGFLFNTKLESGSLYGYAILFTGAVDGSNNEIKASRAIKLFRLDGVDPIALNNHDNNVTSSSNSGLSKVAGVTQLAPTVFATGSAIGDVHHITLQISPSHFTMIDQENGDPANGRKMIDDFALPATYGHGIGFISSYIGHQCSVLSYIIFNNVEIAGSTWPILDMTATPSSARGQVELTYTPPQNAEVVVIQQSTDGGATYTTATTTQPIDPDGGSVVVTGLDNGENYTFRVLVGGGVNEGISNTANATPNGTQSTAPVAADDTYSATGGDTLTIPAGGFLANDTDAEHDPLTAVNISAISDPSKGTLTAHADGSFIFVAAENATGSVTFTYKASDGISQSNTATVTINLTPLKLDVKGTVTDRETAQPIAGATVILKDLAGNKIDTVTTDANGDYSIPNVVANRYNVEVHSPAYSESHREIAVSKASDASDGNVDGVVTEDFALVSYEISLSANPSSVLGNGTASSELTARVVDHDGKPQAGVEVEFAAPNITYGHFVNGLSTITATTDENGNASVRFISAALSGTDPQSVPLTATVDDNANNLHATDTIYVTFTPGAIAGVVTDEAGHPIAGAAVEISRDFDGDGIVDFHAVQITGADGKYSIAIPKGEETYAVAITKPINIGGTQKLVTFTQNVSVSEPLDGTGQTIEANRTVSGVVLLHTPQGSTTVQDGSAGYSVSIVDDHNNPVATGSFGTNGIFNLENLPVGQYTLNIVFNLPVPGSGTVPVIVGHTSITVNANGQINISEVLIDPYGTITDSGTGQPISGVTVTLHYKDGTEVVLPPLPGFLPSDNANPQQSDATGQYAFMVFPNEDYYVTATKTGYEPFNSYTEDGAYIHVGTSIVQYDFAMTRIASTPTPTASPTPTPSPTPVPSSTASPAATPSPTVTGVPSTESPSTSDVPDTGDAGIAFIWFVLLGVSVVGLIVLGASSKRKRKQ